MHRITKTLALGGAVAALAAPVAWGHASVVKLTPKSGATASHSITAVSIKLSEAILGGSIKVYNASGKVVSTKSTLASGKTLLRATVRNLKAGRYTAKAKWIADDGDKQTKNWSFEVR